MKLDNNFKNVLGCLLLLGSFDALANNLQLTNVNLASQNSTAHTTMVSFNISWDNSWRGSSPPANWDAAWVFAKFRTCMTGVATGDWQHCAISSNSSDHVNPAGSIIDAVSDSKGVFIYRSANGAGTFSLQNVQLKWNYGANGLNDNAEVEIRVYAIEMVYIPQGSFSVGSGGNENSAWFTYPNQSVPYVIGSESALPVTQSTSGQLSYSGNPAVYSIPAAFPKGYHDFYAMKYEISQRQYADFLNSLTSVQCAARYHTGSSYRYTISGSWPALTASAGDRACNFLKWADIAAYLDWASLRPMTEFEFEKICRGNNAPVPNEFAWGTTTVTTANYIISNDGSPNETITNASTTAGNANYNASNISGPLRCGIFAASATIRMTAGASYWGVQDMAGNLWEPVVNANYGTGGLNFTGIHGDGNLTINGFSEISTWPGYTSSSQIDGYQGAGMKGGAIGHSNVQMQTSNRNFVSSNSINQRNSDNGGRGIRTAP